VTFAWVAISFGLSAGIPEEEADNDESSGIGATAAGNDATLLMGHNPDKAVTFFCLLCKLWYNFITNNKIDIL